MPGPDAGLIATVNVDLPRRDLSAREALPLIRAHVVDAEAPWYGHLVFAEGAVDRNGRLMVGLGAWLLSYKMASSSKVCSASLGSWGRISFRESVPLVALPRLFLLDSDWLDSTAITDVVAREPLIEGMGETYSLGMSMRAAETGLFWKVDRIFRDRSTQSILTHQFIVEAYQGDIAGEGVERVDTDGGKQLRARSRSKGEDWRDLEVPPP
jgi:hypothetical protein